MRRTRIPERIAQIVEEVRAMTHRETFIQGKTWRIEEGAEEREFDENGEIELFLVRLDPCTAGDCPFTTVIGIHSDVVGTRLGWKN